MKKLLTAALLATAFLTMPAHSAADKYAGEYSGNCGDDVQCSLEITKKKGKNYDVDFVVAHKLDDKKILCKVSGKFKRGPIRYGQHETYDDGLNGQMNGSETYISPEADGDVMLGGAMTAGLACGKWIMQQFYYEIGD